MKLEEKKLSSQVLYDGKVIRVELDDVELPNGDLTKREVARHPAGVTVAALTQDNEMLFVKQYRYPFAENVLELPAGKVDDTKTTPLENAKRELLEETGAVGTGYVSLGADYVSPGFTDEVVYMYMCRVDHFERQQLDEDEFLNVEKIPIEKAVEMVMNNRIPDGKTQTAVLKAWILINGDNKHS
ncbi:MAG: NUDIX hydrolase [Clostridia bacterium]|nr:NUDIX hydrolase [Clostridia bacterium]